MKGGLRILFALLMLSMCAYCSGKPPSNSVAGVKRGRKVKSIITAGATTLKTARKPVESRIIQPKSLLGLILPWLYFMSTAVQIPTLPKYVNFIVNKGSSDVTPDSAKVFGLIQTTDSAFTFLFVNAIGLLSDKFGRKPFMVYSSFG